MNCVFCKIIKKELPADIVFEDDDVIVFKDIKPTAQFHFLVIPKRHIASIVDIEIEDLNLMGKLILTAKKIADDFEFAQKGYRLLVRVEKGGGQEVDHIHLHLISGK